MVTGFILDLWIFRWWYHWNFSIYIFIGLKENFRVIWAKTGIKFIWLTLEQKHLTLPHRFHLWTFRGYFWQLIYPFHKVRNMSVSSVVFFEYFLSFHKTFAWTFNNFPNRRTEGRKSSPRFAICCHLFSCWSYFSERSWFLYRCWCYLRIEVAQSAEITSLVRYLGNSLAKKHLTLATK